MILSPNGPEDAEQPFHADDRHGHILDGHAHWQRHLEQKAEGIHADVVGAGQGNEQEAEQNGQLEEAGPEALEGDQTVETVVQGGPEIVTNRLKQNFIIYIFN